MSETLFSDQTILLANSLLVSVLLFGLWLSDQGQRHNLYWAGGLFALFVVAATFPDAATRVLTPAAVLCTFAGAASIPLMMQGTAVYAHRAFSWHSLGGIAVGVVLSVFLLRALDLRGAAVPIAGAVAVFWYMSWILRREGLAEQIAAVLFFLRGVGLLATLVYNGLALDDSPIEGGIVAVNQIIAMTSGFALLLVAFLENQRELERGRQLLRQGNVLAQRLGPLADTQSVVSESIDVLQKAEPLSTVWIYRLDETSQRLSLLDSGGRLSHLSHENPEIAVEGSVSGEAVRTGRAQVIDHLAEDSRVDARARHLAHEYADDLVGTNIIIPLLSGGRVYGTCSYHLGVQRKLNQADFEAFEAIGQTIGLALTSVDNLEKVTYRANHDSLTGLPNRVALHEAFSQHLEKHPEQGATMFLLDLDKFKDINDTRGHHVGDQLIREVGPRLSQIDAPGEIVASRLGGDEFVLLLLHSLDVADALSLGQRILDAVREPFQVDNLSLSVDGSIGVSIYPQDGRDSHQLLRCADVAMYQAKSTTAPVVAYSQNFDPHSRERLMLMSELKAAISGSQLVLHYQPKVHLESGRITGVEALLRWDHPEHGLVPPGDFIPMAEVSPMINDISLWVMGQAIRDAQSWEAQGLSVAINVSMRNLADDSWYEQAIELIRGADFDPQKLELELTESVFMHAPEEVARKLNALADTGVRVAIDDFGTGFSSLSYLRKLPIHLVKIDQSFVLNLDESLADRQIVDSILSLANAMNLEVVAEGIESEAVLSHLQAAGCAYAQGFFIARPMPRDELEAWLGQRGT
ncbi:MAG: hypothetical protein Cons2KO_28450 [Congregibacter sp.]